MMSVIVIKRSDGGIAIMNLVGTAAEAALSPEQSDKIVAFEIGKWTADHRARVVAWREMPAEALPPDRYFRNAWTDETPERIVDIDMSKARKIHRNHLRRLRAPKLAALDIDYQRADEVGDTQLKQEIAKRKQALRDVTCDPAIETAQTPEELKVIIPAALKS
jgi:hypothetical protein